MAREEHAPQLLSSESGRSACSPRTLTPRCDWSRPDGAPDMLAANWSPKSSPGPDRSGSDRRPELGEDICMVDCAREEDRTCARTRAAPGPCPCPRTAVGPGPVLRSACPATSTNVPGWAELIYGEAGSDSVLQSRCSHVGPPMKMEQLDSL